MQHLDTERLQGYADGSLEESERVVVESHLQGCTRCTTEVEEWRSLYAALGALPQFSPSVSFTDHVMDRVKVARPLPAWAPLVARARQLAERVAPRTSAGWAVAAALLALPLLLGGGLVTWLISKDYITPESLWVFVTDRTSSGLQSLGASALSSLMETQAATWVVQQATSLVATAGLRGLGLLAAVGGALTMLSIWILYRNLFRTPTRESNYVSYSF